MYKLIMRTMLAIVAGLLLTARTGADTDVFEQIKTALGLQGCSHFEFLSIIESDVFDQTDSAWGDAYLASDGRYNIKIGQDQFLCDGAYTYSYSEGSGQVIIEKVEQSTSGGEEFSFIIRLDELYTTHTVKQNQRYRLIRKSDSSGSFPDSLYVTVDKDLKELKRFDYLDVNEEANAILFLKQEYRLKCDDTWFQPNFPDSVEKVRL